MQKTIHNLLNGIVIGASMLLPGVSGGSMAIILGVYDHLILAVSNLRTHFHRNFFFLLTYVIGGAAGMLLFSRPLLQLTNTYEQLMMFLFLGAVCGSIPLLLKKARPHGHSLTYIDLAWPAMGFLLVFIIDMLPEELFLFSSPLRATDYLILFIIGIILSVALVLPGISFSYMLLVLGVYQPLLTAVSGLQFFFLAALGSGVLAGILLTTKALGHLMVHRPTECFLLITGFVLGTLQEIYPGLPAISALLPCLLMFTAGLLIIWQLSRYSTE